MFLGFLQHFLSNMEVFSMTHKRIIGYRIGLGMAALLAIVAILSVPLLTRAAGNRVYYSPDPDSFSPAGSFGSMIAEGSGTGINKLTLNAGPEAYTVTFTINSNNNGTKGTTFFETRKGPTDNDLSGQVKLAPSPDFSEATNTTYLNFTDESNQAPIYVQVEVPACSAGQVGGTFRIQAHPGGTAAQGNGPGVVVYLDCNGYTPPPKVCYDQYGQVVMCTTEES
jgi:hypothetical protein